LKMRSSPSPRFTRWQFLPSGWVREEISNRRWIGLASFFIHSLTAGPEALKPFPKRSPTKLVDIPHSLWYLSCSNGNHPNAGAGRVREGSRKNEAAVAGRGHRGCRARPWGRRKARNNRKAKPVRNDRRPSLIQPNPA
jgi:hypothetical protein